MDQVGAHQDLYGVVDYEQVLEVVGLLVSHITGAYRHGEVHVADEHRDQGRRARHHPPVSRAGI